MRLTVSRSGEAGALPVANVRTGPGVEYPITEKLTRGAVVSATGLAIDANGNSWLQLANSEGFVSLDIVESVDGRPNLDHNAVAPDLHGGPVGTPVSPPNGQGESTTDAKLPSATENAGTPTTSAATPVNPNGASSIPPAPDHYEKGVPMWRVRECNTFYGVVMWYNRPYWHPAGACP